ncbi:hypothetical protein DFH09DRAFT_7261 [Mycena vulgaris]|nr:hypothetical protein DFH09DRAFT_7261 [Mycena vulgaris]
MPPKRKWNAVAGPSANIRSPPLVKKEPDSDDMKVESDSDNLPQTTQVASQRNSRRGAKRFKFEGSPVAQESEDDESASGVISSGRRRKLPPLAASDSEDTGNPENLTPKSSWLHRKDEDESDSAVISPRRRRKLPQGAYDSDVAETAEDPKTPRRRGFVA